MNTDEKPDVQSTAAITADDIQPEVTATRRVIDSITGATRSVPVNPAPLQETLTTPSEPRPMQLRTATILVTALSVLLLVAIIFTVVLDNPAFDVISIASGKPVSHATPSFSSPATATNDLSPSGSQGGSALLVNINTATLTQLDELPDIGESIGQSIIDYREDHGKFETVDDLLNVDGIGEKTLEKLRAFITVDGRSSNEPELPEN